MIISKGEYLICKSGGNGCEVKMLIDARKMFQDQTSANKRDQIFFIEAFYSPLFLIRIQEYSYSKISTLGIQPNYSHLQDFHKTRQHLPEGSLITVHRRRRHEQLSD